MKELNLKTGLMFKKILKSIVCCGNGTPNIFVDGPMLVGEAQIIGEKIGDDTFRGTSGWLEKWKKRHNIGQMDIAWEEGDVKPETMNS